MYKNSYDFSLAYMKIMKTSPDISPVLNLIFNLNSTDGVYAGETFSNMPILVLATKATSEYLVGIVLDFSKGQKTTSILKVERSILSLFTSTNYGNIKDHNCIKRGDFIINFPKLNTVILSRAFDFLVKNKNPRISKSWLTPIQELLLSRLDKNPATKKGKRYISDDLEMESAPKKLSVPKWAPSLIHRKKSVFAQHLEESIRSTRKAKPMPRAKTPINDYSWDGSMWPEAQPEILPTEIESHLRLTMGYVWYQIPPNISVNHIPNNSIFRWGRLLVSRGADGQIRTYQQTEEPIKVSIKTPMQNKAANSESINESPTQAVTTSDSWQWSTWKPSLASPQSANNNNVVYPTHSGGDLDSVEYGGVTNKPAIERIDPLPRAKQYILPTMSWYDKAVNDFLYTGTFSTKAYKKMLDDLGEMDKLKGEIKGGKYAAGADPVV